VSGALNEDDLVREYNPEIRYRATLYSNGDRHLCDDLYQEGVLGLIHAVRRFDPSRGTKFATLARRHIKWRMKNYLRSEKSHRQCHALADACYMAEDLDADNPPHDECLLITVAEALAQTEHCHTRVDLLLMQQVVDATLPALTPRQRQIFTMRYQDDMAPSDIARELHISPARVSQVLAEVVAQIRSAFLGN
jgi:RNA polymerase sigma factor (sigma-70 family)